MSMKAVTSHTHSKKEKGREVIPACVMEVEEALALGAKPLVYRAGSFARFNELNSILSRKTNCCLAHLQ